MKEHPSLLALPGTEAGRFPLVLVVGQEANGTGSTADGAGHYPIEAITARTGKSVPFWDKAYGLVSRTVGLAPSTLKRRCLERGGSPVVFADVSPHPLPSGPAGGNKNEFRARIPELDFERQARRVFAHAAVRERAVLVVVAGSRGCGMDHGAAIFEEACARAGKPFVNIPSLSSRVHGNAQRDAALGAHRASVAECVREFLDLPPALDRRDAA